MEKPLKTQIASRIRAILEKKGWRQQDLVRASGLTKAYISLILSGSMNLTLETIETLERALKEPVIKVPR
jgi:transcriptional regulator with XRE-family HTH domain